jgi:rubrerythrin
MSETIYANETSNPHRDDYWTCPACIHDLGNVGEGTHQCPSCNRMVECTVEHFPSCLARLAEPEAED